MRRISGTIIAALLSLAICVGLSACGNTDATSGSSAVLFNDAVDQLEKEKNPDNAIKQSEQEEIPDNATSQPDQKENAVDPDPAPKSSVADKCGILFTIIDSNTVKASINDPKILAYAMDMTEINLKLFIAGTGEYI